VALDGVLDLLDAPPHVALPPGRESDTRPLAHLQQPVGSGEERGKGDQANRLREVEYRLGPDHGQRDDRPGNTDQQAAAQGLTTDVCDSFHVRVSPAGSWRAALPDASTHRARDPLRPFQVDASAS